MDDNRNMIVAIALSLVILVAWQFFVSSPQIEKERQRRAVQETQQSQVQSDGAQPSPGSSSVPVPGGTGAPAAPGMPATAPTREAALAAAPRIAIDTPLVGGSISLRGGRIDDIILKTYRETVKPGSKPITLLSPSGSASPYYAEYGWVNAVGGTLALPGGDTLWSVEQDGPLTVGKQIVLAHDNGQGLTFRRTLSIDSNYLITVKQSVENRTDAPVTLHPYALISRHGTPSVAGYYVLHEGLVGVLGEQGLEEVSYSSIKDDRQLTFEETRGWLGITDKYWAAVLIPDQKAKYTAHMTASDLPGDRTKYQTDYLLDGHTIAPGASGGVEGHLFAGAKVVNIVDGYKDNLGIYNFDLLIDWGWFYFITKPLFYMIDFFFRLVGNFGISILLVTVVIKAAFFPLANKSYVSMSRMKMVQPEMVKIRERFSDDKARQQQAMMELYKKEKINPMSGCLPIAVQIPVFFALYKVLFVTIEMRHAPFFGWIQDLAAPDPTSLFTLFGMIPWDPPQFLMIGIWPLIMGVTMFMQMRLNPPPPDPTQAMIFNWMPLFFTFLLGSFPAGLVIYWAWNNTLSILQQYVIMRRQGVEVNMFGNIKAMFQKKAKE